MGKRYYTNDEHYSGIRIWTDGAETTEDYFFLISLDYIRLLTGRYNIRTHGELKLTVTSGTSGTTGKEYFLKSDNHLEPESITLDIDYSDTIRFFGKWKYIEIKFDHDEWHERDCDPYYWR